MKIFAHWDFGRPAPDLEYLRRQLWDARSRPLKGAASARTPYRLERHERSVSLEIGPVPARQEALREALLLFHHCHETLHFSLPNGDILTHLSGIELEIPTGPLPEGAVDDLTRLATPLLAELADRTGVARPSLQVMGDHARLSVREHLLPEVFSRVMPAAAAIAMSFAPGHREVSAGEALWRALLPSPPGLPRPAIPALERVLPRGQREAVERLIWGVPPPVRVEPPTPVHAVRARAPGLEPHGEGLEIVPFRSGGRPIDDVDHPGTGTSEASAFLLSSGAPAEPEDAGLWTLFRLREGAGQVLNEQGRIEVTMTAAFLGHPGTADAPTPIPGIDNLPVPARIVTRTSNGAPTLSERAYGLAGPVT